MAAARRRGQTLAFILAGLLAVAAGLVLEATGALDRLERDSVDARFALRGTQPAPEDLVVVQIDDVTFGQLNLQWPFPRSVHGKLIDRLSDEGAAVIAYDVQFTEPTTRRQDGALKAAAKRAGNVIFATTEVTRTGGTDILGGDRVLERLGAEPGISDLPPDDGGVIRTQLYDVAGLKAFSLVAEEVASGDVITKAEFGGGKRAWTDYPGPPGTIETVSFSRALRGDTKPGTFEGKTVVVGASAPALQDVHPTSTSGDELMSGPEVQAAMIHTARGGFPLDEAPGGLDAGLIVLLGLVAPVTGIFLGARMMLAAALAAAAALVVGAYAAFEAGVIIDVVDSLVALIVGAVGALAVYYVGAAMDRQRTRDLFARFVPPSVVDEVVDRTGGDLRLGGVRCEVTVMFADLRGFTTFAEAREPDQVIDVLNHFLGSMSDAIMDHGGTLVAYLGDGILAVFGAPLEQDDHADRAVAAAREMVGPRLQEFNAWLRKRGLGDGFRMGIGLNSGPIMSGNVGSERRLEYTAIGDTTNTASRIEGLTKGTPHQVLMADTTRDAVDGQAEDVVFFEEMEVRGRKGRVRLWGLAEDPPES